MHTNSWFSGGVERTLVTTCNEGEGVDACLERHLSDLAFFQEVYPEDPED